MTDTRLATRQLMIRTGLFMSGYLAVNAAAIAGAFDDIQRPGAIGFALVVAAPIAGQIWSLITWMRDSDEYVRALAAKRFIVAMGCTMAVASAWGFLELYAKMPHISAAMIFPLFCAVLGLVTPLIRTTH